MSPLLLIVIDPMLSTEAYDSHDLALNVSHYLGLDLCGVFGLLDLKDMVHLLSEFDTFLKEIFNLLLARLELQIGLLLLDWYELKSNFILDFLLFFHFSVLLGGQ